MHCRKPKRLHNFPINIYNQIKVEEKETVGFRFCNKLKNFDMPSGQKISSYASNAISGSPEPLGSTFIANIVILL